MWDRYRYDDTGLCTNDSWNVFNVRIGYYEYKKDSEKERLFLEVKDKKLIDIDFFIFYFTQEVIDIMELTNKCCKKQLQLTR